MANPARLMLGLVLAEMADLATATVPQYGSQSPTYNPTKKTPRQNMTTMADAASIMAQAVAGEAGIGLVSVIEFDIV